MNEKPFEVSPVAGMPHEREAMEQLVPRLKRQEDRKWVMKIVDGRTPVHIKRSNGGWQEAVAHQLHASAGMIDIAWPKAPGSKELMGKTVFVEQLVSWRDEWESAQDTGLLRQALAQKLKE